MKKLLFLFASVILAFPAFADGQKDQLLRLLRAEDNRLESLLVDKVVKLELSEDWWTLLNDPEDSTYRDALAVVTRVLPEVGTGVGLEDISSMNDATGRKADSPPVLALADSYAEKVQVVIKLDAKPDDAIKKNVVSSLFRIGQPMTEAKPRGGSFHITFTFDPAVMDYKGSVSDDGNTYTATLPVYTDWSQRKLEQTIKLGTE